MNSKVTNGAAGSVPQYLEVGGRRLEYVRLPGTDPAAPELVFLHEGLGCLALWRDFPQRLVVATGHGALVYSRYGYGSSAVLERARETDFMHEEALEALPALLDQLGIERPVLFGHSDGGSIALIHAARARRAVAALVVLAPHVMVEEFTLAAIRQAREAFATTDLPQRLGRYHQDAVATFRGWNDIWLHPQFAAWSIEEMLAEISVPVLAIQGHGDEYGTMAQIERIAELAPEVRLAMLEDCGHSPQRDQPQAVIEATSAFLRGISRAGTS